MCARKTVFLTGATGTMGMETLKEFVQRCDRFNIRILALPHRRDRRVLRKYMKLPFIEVIWGDMTDDATIDQCIQGVDYVLHIGALVSPEADKHPKKTMEVNYGSTLSIIRAIKAQPHADDIGLVYIGTVAETGCRMPPIHWGRCGDPIKGSMFDYYALSKIASERAVFESGLKKWVSLRQTGILPVKSSAQEEPIIFHQNANNVLEWVTAHDSGVLMANVCEDWIPDTFWRKCYNIGGGMRWRYTNWQFIERMLHPLNIRFQQLFNANDLALYNFHGQWYTDSDELDAITHYRSDDPDAFFAKETRMIQRIKKIPLINLLIPTAEKLKIKFSNISHKVMGTRWMIHNNHIKWIKAFFGSKEKYHTIKSWHHGYELIQPSIQPAYLDHGYDESKPIHELDIDDMRTAAAFRGGQCLSSSMDKGDLYTKLHWRCAYHHEFDATPNLILRGGHWCDECERADWDYAEMAKVNPFFAQVWKPLHGNEDGVRIHKAVTDISVDHFIGSN